MLQDDDDIGAGYQKRGSSYTAPLNFLNDTANDKVKNRVDIQIYIQIV